MEKSNSHAKKTRLNRRGMDFTGWNVQKLDKNEKKVLEPLLQKALTRRRQGIERSSYYRRLRVKLLPHNIYFKQDIVDLRRLFHIPEGQIAAVDLSGFSPRRPVPRDKWDTLDPELMVTYWFEIHRCHFLELGMPDNPPSLPKWLVDSATTPVPDNSSLPEWLNKQPNVPERHAKLFDLRVPLMRCIAILIQDYQLPWLCGLNLQRYILTQNEAYLRFIPPFDITIRSVSEPVEAFTIEIDWIDEYTTKQQWAEIYTSYIRPRQKLYWEQRGDLPHSKQIELEGLLEPWFIQLYSDVRENGISVDRALKKLSENQKLANKDVEPSIVYRRVNRLDVIFKPEREM